MDKVHTCYKFLASGKKTPRQRNNLRITSTPLKLTNRASMPIYLDRKQLVEFLLELFLRQPFQTFCPIKKADRARLLRDHNK